MGLDKIIEEVRRQGGQEASKILESAQSEAASIIAKAKSEARGEVESAKKEASEAVERERVEELSKVKGAAFRIVAEARGTIVERNLEAVWSKVLAFRDTGDYGRLLASLTYQAMADLGPGSRVFCRSEDERLLVSIKPAGYIECAGGVLIEDSTGRIRVDSRIESLFSENRSKLAAAAYAHLFRGEV
jgi:V/A-type H+/Na+-transporting ATPase subunit E